MKWSLFSGLALSQLISAAPIYARPQARELFAFSDGTFIENLAVRQNGHVLFGTFGRGRVYDLDPNAESPEPRLVAELPGADSVTGIAEFAPDQFAMTAGVRTGEFTIENFKLFTISFGKKPGHAPRVKAVADLNGTGLLNGMSELPSRPNTVLSADATNGSILRLDTVTGAQTVVVTDDRLKPAADETTVPLGVNGIHIFGDSLYFTNSALGLFGSVKIDKSGRQAGPVKIIAKNPTSTGGLDAWDDFAILARAGSAPLAYIGSHPNAIAQVGLTDGSVETIFGGGNSTVLRGPTSLALSKDKRKMYVVTAGTNGAGGQVWEIAL